MRILTVTNLYPTSRDPTFGTFVGDQVAALRRHPEVQECAVLFVDGRTSRWNYLRGFGRLRAQVHRGAYDVVLAHYGLAGAIAVSQRRVPVVATFHGGDLVGERWQRLVSRQVHRLSADAVSVSRRGLAELPGPAHHLTCGIDLELFTPRDRASARRRFDVPDDHVALLFPSSPQRPEKMHERFLAVLEQLRAEGVRVHELRLQGLQRTEVPELMAAADLMVMTSRFEATPVSVMEALACGLPVLAPAVGDLPSMLAEADYATVSEFDAADFAAAARELLARAPQRRRPDPVSARYDERELAERLVAVLAHAAAAH
ncbi:MAG: teichuronic acid biosynthesis glycosyltransferase TuaC [Solirubrobacteraceae bacterium]|nr:teichuronic acid biosynthesis glycosyltransferase TuaC [Solirubrobacteraceae bacterium]